MDIATIAIWLVVIVVGVALLTWVVKNWDLVLAFVFLALIIGSIPFMLWMEYLKLHRVY